MPAGADRLIHYVRRIASPSADPSADAALLSRFVNDRDATAFEALVACHGPMVFRVCHRLLADAQDAEDAFQATFLVLAKKAASVRPPGALPAWLHGVARRMALSASTSRARRRSRETPTSDLTSLDPHPDPLTELTAREALRILDEEVQRLPAMYRLPVVLCCLEGLSQEEAARQLGWTPGSVKGRLERGRKRLHRRLIGRGLELAAALSLLEIARASAAGPSAALLASTAKAGMAFVAGNDNISREVARLTERGLRYLTLARAKTGLMVLLAVGVIVAGAGTLAHQVLAGKQPAAEPESQAKDAAAEEPQSREIKQSRTDLHGDPLPAGVLARLGTVRLRATGAEVRFSADGKSILTVTGRQVKWWDADTGRLREQRELPVEAEASQTCLSPSGRILAIRGTGLKGSLEIWDVPSGKRLHRLKTPPGQGIFWSAFSPDGKTLAVAEHGPRNILRFWDLESGEQHELKGTTGRKVATGLGVTSGLLECLVFSPDGKLLVARDGINTHCWQVAKREHLWQAKSGPICFLAFTPDGRTVIASPGYRERIWHAWDAATGKPAQGLKLPEGYDCAQLAIAPDGRTMVFAQSRFLEGADGRARLWDLRTGKLLHTLSGGGKIGAFSPDGRSFLTHDGTIQRWDLATGKELLPNVEALGHWREVSRAVYSPDGRRMATSADDGTIRLWDVASTRPLHILRGHQRDAYGLAFTPDGKLLVSGSTEGELFVWDAITGKQIRRIPLHDPKRGEKKQNVSRLHVTPDGRTVIVLGHDPDDSVGTASILSRWDLVTGQRQTLSKLKASDGLYTAFSPDGRLLASRGELLDTTTGQTRVKLEGGSEAWMGFYAFSPDGRLVAGLATHTEKDGDRYTTKMDAIPVWDAATGRTVRRIPTDWVGQLAFTPDGRYLAAADLDGIRLWELATGAVVLRHKAHEQLPGSYGNSFASCLSFAPDGRTLATGHRDSTALIWNVVPPIRTPMADDLPRLWDELIGSDAARAYAAMWQLADAPALSLSLLQKHPRAAKPAPAEQTRSLLADLDGDDFRKREAAAARLRELGDRAAGALREALQSRPNLETRRRLEELLKALEAPPTGVALRQVRAVAVLERIGTPEARELLNKLRDGDPHARLTREAKASLERLATRFRNG